KVCCERPFRRAKALPHILKVGWKPTVIRQSEGLPCTEQAASAPLVKIHLQPFSAPICKHGEPIKE
ncbi:MAG TPA: hypothetical protein VJ022_14685, partial [Anaerolineales bacterium]|nr:hypothetical protein [Anaerolineales bacterium]